MVVIWFPAVLMFSSVCLAYIFWPESFDAALSKNVIYTLVAILAIYWFATFNAFRGMKSANKYCVSAHRRCQPNHPHFTRTSVLARFLTVRHHSVSGKYFPFLRRHRDAGCACAADEKSGTRLSKVSADSYSHHPCHFHLRHPVYRLCHSRQRHQHPFVAACGLS